MGEASESSKRRITNPLDYKVIVLIIGIAVVFQITLEITADDDPIELDAYDIADPSIIGVSAAAAFYVSRKYWGSEVFGKSYLSLGIALALLSIGDGIYVYYENTGQDPYPSIADVFYFGFYPFGLIHLIMNTRYFKPKFELHKKIWLVATPILIVIIFAYVAISEWGIYEELPFDLFYGMIFVAGASALLAWAILGAAVFRHSVLGAVWLLLAVSITIQGAADVWYYYLEIFEAYTPEHVTTTLWIFAFMLITYALILHRKII